MIAVHDKVCEIKKYLKNTRGISFFSFIMENMIEWSSK